MLCDQGGKSRHYLYLDILLLAGLSAFYFFLSSAFFKVGAYAELNTLFDYDVPWYLSALGEPWSYNTVWIKHPLIYLFHLPVVPLTWLGMDSLRAVILLCAFNTGAAVVLMRRVLQCLGLNGLEQAMVVSMFAFSPLILVLGGMPEAYTLINFSATLLWLILVRAILLGHRVPVFHRAIAGAITAGITSFFVVFYVLIEVALYLKSLKRIPSLGEFFRSELIKASVILLLAVSLLMLIVYAPMIELGPDGVLHLVKRTVWAVIQKSEKIGPLLLLHSFYIAPLLPPELAVVQLPGNQFMLDYRGADHPLWHFPLILIYAGILVVGFVSLFRSQADQRWVAGTVLVWLVFTFFFHLQYQYRGSTFLYTPHHWSAVIILFGVSLRQIRLRFAQYIKGVYLAALLLVFGVALQGWFSIRELLLEIQSLFLA